MPANIESIRVNRKQIYDHYSYTGEQKWDYLRVDVVYKYKCKGACPDRLSLDMSRLALVDNSDLLSGTYNFEKIREKDYEFSTPIQ